MTLVIVKQNLLNYSKINWEFSAKMENRIRWCTKTINELLNRKADLKLEAVWETTHYRQRRSIESRQMTVPTSWFQWKNDTFQSFSISTFPDQLSIKTPTIQRSAGNRFRKRRLATRKLATKRQLCSTARTPNADRQPTPVTRNCFDRSIKLISIFRCHGHFEQRCAVTSNYTTRTGSIKIVANHLTAACYDASADISDYVYWTWIREIELVLVVVDTVAVVILNQCEYLDREYGQAERRRNMHELHA